MKRETTLIGICILLAVTIFIWIGFKIKEGEKMIPNQRIVTILEELNCPYLPYAISESIYSDISIVESRAQKVDESDYIDGMVVELYRTDGSGMIGIIRKNEKVMCAQYINEVDPNKYLTNKSFSNEVYVHTYETKENGIYIKMESAYFDNGKNISYRYTSSLSEAPDNIYYDDSNCILSLLNN